MSIKDVAGKALDIASRGTDFLPGGNVNAMFNDVKDLANAVSSGKKSKTVTEYMDAEEAKKLKVGQKDSKGRTVANIESAGNISDDEALYKTRLDNSASKAVSNAIFGSDSKIGNTVAEAAFKSEDTIRALGNTASRLGLSAIEGVDSVIHIFKRDAKPLIDRTAWDAQNKPVTFLGKAAAMGADIAISKKAIAKVAAPVLSKVPALAKAALEHPWLSKKARDTVSYAIAADSHDDALVNSFKDTVAGKWIAEKPFIGAALNMMQTHEDDSPLVRRLKLGCENALMDTVFEGVSSGIHAYSAARTAPDLTKGAAVELRNNLKHVGIAADAADSYVNFMAAYAHNAKAEGQTFDDSMKRVLIQMQKVKDTPALERINKVTPGGLKGMYVKDTGIALTNAADGSTLSHEFLGHFLLDDITDRAAQGTLSKKLQPVYEGIKGYLGKPGNQGWSKSQQEKFAEGMVNWLKGETAPKGNEAAFDGIKGLMGDLVDDGVITGGIKPSKVFGANVSKLFETKWKMTPRQAALTAEGITSTQALKDIGKNASFAYPEANEVNIDAIENTEQLKSVLEELHEKALANISKIRNQEGYADEMDDAIYRFSQQIGISESKLRKQIIGNDQMEAAFMAHASFEDLIANAMNEVAIQATAAQSDASKALLAGRYMRLADLLDGSKARIAAAVRNKPSVLFQLDDDLLSALKSKDAAKVAEHLKLDNANKAESFLHTIVSAGSDADAHKRFNITNMAKDAWDAGSSAWTSNLLMRPATHVRNIIGNSMASALNPFRRFTGSIVRRGLDKTASAIGVKEHITNQALLNFLDTNDDTIRQNWKAMGQAYYQLVAGTAEVFHNAKGLMKSDRLFYHEGKSLMGINEMAVLPWAEEASDSIDTEHWLGQVWNSVKTAAGFPSKMLEFEDNWSKVVALKQNITYRLYDEATEAGFTGTEADQFVRDNFGKAAELMKNESGKAWYNLQGSPERIKALKYQMEHATFQDMPDKITKWIMDGKKMCPLLHPIIPFVKTPANVRRYCYENIPVLSMIYENTRESLASGGVRANEVIGKWAITSALMAGAIPMCQKGYITGAEPKKASLAKAWKATGWQPYSIHLGDKYYSYAGIDELKFLLGHACDMAELSQGISGDDQGLNEEFGELAAWITTAGMSIVTDNDSFESLSEFYDSMSDDSKGDNRLDALAKMGNKYATALISGAVPSIITSGARDIGMMSNAKHELDGLVDQLKSKLPILSDTLPDQYNHITGKPYTYSPGGSILPFNISEREYDIDDDTMDAIFNHTGAVVAPSRMLNGTRLSGQQYSDLCRINGTIEINGKTYLQALSEAVHKDKWNNIDTDKQDILLRRVTAKYKSRARKELVKLYPELAEDNKKQQIKDDTKLPPIPTADAMNVSLSDVSGGYTEEGTLSDSERAALDELAQ